MKKKIDNIKQKIEFELYDCKLFCASNKCDRCKALSKLDLNECGKFFLKKEGK